MENPYAPPPDGAGRPQRRPAGSRGRAQGQDAGPEGGPGGAPGQPPHEQPPGWQRRPARPRAERTPPPPPDPDDLRVVRRRMGVALALIVAALITSRLRLPLQVSSVAFALGAFGAGVWALLGARRPGLRETMAPMLAVGLVFTLLLALSMAAPLVFWSQQMELQECLDRSVTISSQERCQQAYEDAVQEWIDRMTRPTVGQVQGD